MPCDVIVYPGGQVNDLTLPAAQQHYDYGIQASGDGGDPGNRVNYPPIGTYTIKRRSLSMLSDIEKIKAEIDITIETNGLLIFMTHVNAYDSGNTDISAELAKYTEVVEYLRTRGYDFEPLTVILDRFRNVVEVGDWSRSGSPRDYFVVGADGTVGVGAMSGHVVAPTNKYKGATLPSGYPQEQVTTNMVSGDEDTPTTQGVLTAYVFGQNGYRTYMPSNANTLYTQIKKPDGDTWNSWVDVTKGYVNSESNNKVHGGTTPADCPSRISVCLVSTASLTAELPEAKTGVLTTYKISTTASNTWQEWKPLSSNVQYIRRAKSSTAWAEWQPQSGHNTAAANAYKGATLPSGYPQNMVTTNRVSSDSDTPVSSGILTAYMFGEHAYRTFMPSSANTLYTQIKKPDGDSWNSWVDVTKGYVNQASNNSVTSETTPSACPSRISICTVSNSEQIALLPEGRTGTLTTYKISTDAANTWQEWKPFYGLTVYTRKAKSASAWGPWYKFEPVLA